MGTFNTEFDFKQPVFFLYEDRIRSGAIQCVSIKVGIGAITESYLLPESEHKDSSCQWIDVKRVGATKEELLAKL